MQRKNGILKQRNGFAMIMAIFFMIVIATLLSFMLSSTAETTQRTTNIYLSEQAQLIARSAVEYAVLRVSGEGRTAANCVNSFNTQYSPNGNPLLDVNVTIQYIGLETGTLCNNYITSINTPESNGTMLIDVYVSDNSALNLSEPIRYHRRTLQKL